MPHLSPMNWLLMLSLMQLLLLTLSSNNWWKPTYMFPKASSSNLLNISIPQWKWSL